MKQLKITKLFHWLYALLMLAPCFAVLFTCLYVAFNKNAYESYSGTTSQSYYQPIQYDTNEVSSVDDLIVGNVYSISVYEGVIVRNDTFSDLNSNFDFYFYDVDFSIATNTTRYIRVSYTYNNYSPIVCSIFDNGSNGIYGQNAFIYTGGLVSYQITGSLGTILEIVACPFISSLPPQYELVEVDSSTLDNVFYYSLDKVATSDIFGWARNSFIAQPFSYITGLFGMSADNPLNIYFSYWASISIIWLVFDIVLYVPLLAHKWLDEGGI